MGKFTKNDFLKVVFSCFLFKVYSISDKIKKVCEKILIFDDFRG